eukprot:XP_025984345.1 OTU domain-containing protein 3-like [Glycine max]
MRMNPKRNCINGDDTFRVHHAGRGNRVRMDVDLGFSGDLRSINPFPVNEHSLKRKKEAVVVGVGVKFSQKENVFFHFQFSQNLLDAPGSCVVEVTADGNCFFRLTTLKSMETDGTWAGHMELQAASPVTRSNVCIHRVSSPRWYIRNFGDRGIRMIHLSYHDGEHYNSVRLKDDPFDGPARPIVIKADADLSVPSHQTKVVDNKPHGRAGREAFQPGSIRMVMAGTGCENAEKVEQILEQVNGDVDAAIEFLIAEQRTEECSANSDSLPSQANTHNS